MPNVARRLTSEPATSADVQKEYGLDSGSAVRLAGALELAGVFAQSGGTPGRWSWALVGSPVSGQVDAVLTLDVYDSRSGSDVYRAAAERSVPSGFDVITRTIDDVEVAGREAVVIHELIAPEPGEATADPASERASLALFSAETGTMLVLRVTTQDMMLFENIVAWLLDLGATVELTVGSPA